MALTVFVATSAKEVVSVEQIGYVHVTQNSILEPLFALLGFYSSL